MSSNPVIDSVTPGPVITAQVGTKVKVDVVGHDDDTRTMIGQLVLNDQDGHPSQPATITIHWVDGLTLKGTTDDGTPVAISGMSATFG